MPLYRYVHASTVTKKKIPKIFSYGFMLAGLGVLLWTMWPIASFLFIHNDAMSFGITNSNSGSIVSPVVFAAEDQQNLSDVNRWYPTKPQKKGSNIISDYVLTIPVLGIENALVKVAGDDLMQSLIHYGGTALPGQLGTSVIFGHSTLPQFFSQTNYKTIFSTLPTIKIGDEIIVQSDSVQYSYEVFDMKIVSPKDLTALEQQKDDSYITLVTCVPPGTYWKRLNVHARIKKI